MNREQVVFQCKGKGKLILKHYFSVILQKYDSFHNLLFRYIVPTFGLAVIIYYLFNFNWNNDGNIEESKVQRALFRKISRYAAYMLLIILQESWTDNRSFTPFFQFFKRVSSIKEISRCPEFWLFALQKGINKFKFKSIN